MSEGAEEACKNTSEEMANERKHKICAELMDFLKKERDHNNEIRREIKRLAWMYVPLGISIVALAVSFYASFSAQS